MRKITYRNIEYQFILDKHIFYNVIIKNHKEYYHFVNNLIQQISYGNQGDFTYSKDNQEKPFDKHAMIIKDMFSFDLTSRKMLNRLYNEVKKQMSFTNFQERMDEFEQAYINLLEHIKNDISINIDYQEEIDLISLFKFAGIVPIIDQEDFLASLVDYVKIIVELLDIDIIWTINLKNFLSSKDLNDFIYEMNLMKINILNIEVYERYDKINNQINLVIDEDLCDYNII